MTPFHLLGFRFAIAFLSLSILRIIGIININLKGKNLKKLFLLALFQPGIYFICETTGMLYTTSSEAGMMIALIPVAVTILAAIILNERPTFLQSVFVALSVGGVFFIIFNRGASPIEGNYLGLLLLGGAVIAAGFYNIISRQLSLEFSPVEITYVMMGFGAFLFNLIAIYEKNFNLTSYFSLLSNKDVMISVIYLGVLSSVVAFFMMNYTLSKITAAESAVFANLTTVVSIVAGVVLRNEPFFKFQVVGAVLIIIGVWGTNYFGRPVVEKGEEIYEKV
ncbi:Permease of the drug/metabolite transporter (DMT) superfamily [Halanaerobium saccharolyticum subsp. saccharolyticum DSM 6643]|uniref:Permease of the drug/metabolite transporter (DMT) superfamily n=2 Tax=Halanaerobium saccharolyticum TaxID=43595 RepID=M5E0D2_9FIRM|nr:Permease of the drug/metabolite transporter (DMT) superfamily [Halanaerobium saccharolyticum subsp. saccharolyticum DSM 6643]